MALVWQRNFFSELQSQLGPGLVVGSGNACVIGHPGGGDPRLIIVNEGNLQGN